MPTRSTKHLMTPLYARDWPSSAARYQPTPSVTRLHSTVLFGPKSRAGHPFSLRPEQRNNAMTQAMQEPCNLSTTRSARGCHPALRYVVLPVCPGRTHSLGSPPKRATRDQLIDDGVRGAGRHCRRITIEAYLDPSGWPGHARAYFREILILLRFAANSIPALGPCRAILTPFSFPS